MKPQRRKPPRKQHPRPPKLDDDLRELAAVINEHQLESNSANWFSLPWRDGWNAAGLSSAAWPGYASSSDWRLIYYSILELFSRKESPFLYEEISGMLDKVSSIDETIFLYSTLRCIQVAISNSSGGGYVYNSLLRMAFDKYPDHENQSKLVMEYRCKDAINTTAQLQGDGYDRSRNAFKIAWNRGLFAAAYSIKPVR